MNFHRKYIECWDLSIHVRELGYNACNLAETFVKDPRANRITIRGKIYDAVKIKVMMDVLEKQNQVKILQLPFNAINSNGAKYLADGLKYTNITTLNLYQSDFGSTGMKYLADILKDTCITDLHLSQNNIGDDGIIYLASGLKNSNVISLSIGDNGIKSHTIRYLADVLKDTNIVTLDLSNLIANYNKIADDGLKYLSENLKHSNIKYLGLDSNDISNLGVKYLAGHLKDTCVISLSLNRNKIDNSGFQFLVQTLRDTQIINLGGLEYDMDKKIFAERYMSQNKINASKIKDTFEKLVAPNSQTYDLEFITLNEIKDLDMEEYLYIIKTITENPNVKGHIFHLIIENNCQNYPNIIRKINEFIITLPNKFNTFIDNKLPILVESFDLHDFVKLVKQFENVKLCEVVQNLLLHRVLYYVDENAEILHPYIYKMLDKYSMPLYNEQVEPNKREKIISFYQDHQEIAGAQEIIDLLKSKPS